MFERIHRSMAKAGWVRGDNSWLAGVCAGLAPKLGLSVRDVRLLCVVLALIPGNWFFGYLALWICMPSPERVRELTGAAPAPYQPLQYGVPSGGTQDVIYSDPTR